MAIITLLSWVKQCRACEWTKEIRTASWGIRCSHLRWRQKGKTGWKQAGPGFCAADFAWFEFQRCIHPGILNDDIVSWFFRYLQEQPQNAQHERSAKDICLGSGRQGGFLSTMFQGFLAESRIVCLWRIRTQNKAWSFTYFHVSKFNQILLTSWLWTQTCLLEACGWNLCMSAKIWLNLCRPFVPLCNFDSR